MVGGELGGEKISTLGSDVTHRRGQREDGDRRGGY
jgi:hypothetical protein